MKRLPRLMLAAFCGLLLAPSAYPFDPTPQPGTQAVAAKGTVQAAFTPWDDVEGLILAAIEGSKKQILVQAYLLSSRKLASALIAAHRRGLDVRILADAGQIIQGVSSRIPELAASGVPVWLETKYQNAHNKIIVIDAPTPDATIITGSYNFTWSAQHKNAENILITRGNPALASRYALNWERHQQESTPYSK